MFLPGILSVVLLGGFLFDCAAGLCAATGFSVGCGAGLVSAVLDRTLRVSYPVGFIWESTGRSGCVVR